MADISSPREALLNKVTNILETPLEDLISNSKADLNKGVLIYNEIKPKIEELKGYLSLLDLNKLQALPDFRFKMLETKLEPIFQELNKIQGVDKNPNQPDRQQKQNSIHFFNLPINNGGNNYYEKEKEGIWKIIVEAITLENQQLHNQADPSGFRKELLEILDKSRKIENEIESVLNSAKTELSIGGVSVHADIFGNQAGVHSGLAKKWRLGAICLLLFNAILVISILVLVTFFLEDQSVRIEVGIFGAVLVSLVSYGVVLCAKNFFAEKHNQNVNQHRANCLGTYNTFIDSADEERKAAILLHATNTIFSHQRSGYLTRDTDTNNPNPILEIVRNVVTNPKSD
ncbi:hypothetical protein [Flagellimonas oceanensis]|uniref:hypothetical protein n=1 Tax=Flagellimonas oceanensis TaxID=2499163 RepID=UPI000F8C3FE7|nr:hypothetical protein [Allomuricauda oceanensis]